MSSIAYVTDQEMIEFHRLCGNSDVNFWRLSARAGFSDFKHGDLLFFYAYGQTKRKKGFVGYAHFEGTSRLTLDQMWKRYGTRNGYADRRRLKEAIQLAARDGNVPETMNCLHLSDCVYFSSPVYPEDVGISINEKLESYTYLDRQDPSVTVRILRVAETIGIDNWSKSQNFEPDTIFMLDEVRQVLALIARELGKENVTPSERKRIRRQMNILLEEGYERIRNSDSDLFKMDGDTVRIAFPFAAQANDRSQRIRDVLGKMTWYRLKAEQLGLRGEGPVFEILAEETEEQKEFLLNAANHV